MKDPADLSKRAATIRREDFQQIYGWAKAKYPNMSDEKLKENSDDLLRMMQTEIGCNQCRGLQQCPNLYKGSAMMGALNKAEHIQWCTGDCHYKIADRKNRSAEAATGYGAHAQRGKGYKGVSREAD